MMFCHRFAIALGTLVLMLLTACSGEPPSGARAPATAPSSRSPEAETGPHADVEGDEPSGPIRLDPAALAAAGIRVEALDATDLSEELRAPGEVLDNAYGTTLITPRVDALVVRRHARLGDEVAAGAPLVTLSSIEVAQAQGALRLAEQEWERVRTLGSEAISGRRYNEAQVAVEQARATAKAYGIGRSSGGATHGEFTLTAPHAGRLTEDAFVVGERIEPGRTLFRLVDESIVWVDAKLPADVAQRIAIDRPAQVVLGERRIAGKVVQRAHRTAEDTRTALIRIEVPNTGDLLHSGDYVEIYLEAGDSPVASAPRLSVPTTALLQLEGDTVVFRQSADGALTPVPVRIGEAIADRTVIREGLALDDRIVVEGAYALKAQRLKSQLGEDHD